MSGTTTSSLSRDLSRVAERLGASDVLGQQFCERLTRSLTQLWGLAEASMSDDDLDCFDAILIRIAPTAPVDARVDLSDRISTTRRPPRRLLLALARDIVEIARPVLENSPALTEADLVDIARTCGLGHMEAIAERHELPIRVTDVLVLRGDDIVRRIVAGNGGAHLSDKSFARLSLQAREDPTVESRLVHRDDLPDLIVRFLLENGSQKAREILIERAEQAPTKGPSACLVSIRLAEAGWLEPYDFEAAAEILGPLKNARHQLDGFVRRLAQADHFAEIVQVMAAVSELPLDTVKHMMVGLDTSSFVVVARFAALKPETVRAVLSTGPWLHRLDNRARDAAVAEFQALSIDDARARLRSWLAAEQN